MDAEIQDYNGAGEVIIEHEQTVWGELLDVINHMKPRFKASDQAGIQGIPIFDPVGTNAAFRLELLRLDWRCKLIIPKEFQFLGKDAKAEPLYRRALSISEKALGLEHPNVDIRGCARSCR